MSRFDVDTDGLKSAAGRCDGISDSIINLGNQIRDVKYSLDNEMGRYSGVISALNTCYENSRRCGYRVSQFGNVGTRIANEYANTENSISGNISLDKFGNAVNLRKIFNPQVLLDFLHKFPFGPRFLFPFIIGTGPISALSYMIDAIYADPSGAATDIHVKHKFWEPDGKKYKWDSDKKKWIEEDSKDKDGKSHTKEYSLEREWDPKAKKWVEAAEKEKKTGFAGMEKEVKLHEWEANTPSDEFWSASGSMEGEYGKLEGSVDVAKYETHASAYAGLLTAGGAVGASFTAFSATGLAELGDDNLGLYASGTVTAGKVGAEASGSIGLFDKYGNVNPNAEIGVSAEAIGGEVSASAGAKVLGTDVGVTGSLNYGVGAHANVGFSDGKLSLDVGATLGVGASVKLDIDVSGTVNAVCDGAKAAWDGAKSIWNSIWG